MFTTGQAMSYGIPPSTLADMARRLGIVDLGRDLWACAGSPNTYRRKLWAAKLGLGENVAFTGRTVLWLRNIISANPPLVDVLAGPDLHLRARKGFHFYRGASLEDDDTVNLEKFRCVSVYRALTDAASVAPVETLVRWIPAMDRLRLGDLDGLAAYAAARGRFVGVVNLRAATAILRADLPHSRPERIARRSLRAAGLTPYVRPYPVRHRGRTVAEIDLAFPPVLYGAEVDGPHHLIPEVAAADKARDRQLMRLGWIIERFPHDEVLADPAGFVAEVMSGLDGAKQRNPGISNR